MRRVRGIAALLAILSGLSQTALPWMLSSTPEVLLGAVCGSAYLLLGLGLFGVGRFSLMLAIVFPALRAWFGLWPLPLATLETARMVIDISIAALCIPVLWSCLHPDYEPRLPGLAEEPREHGRA